MPKIDHLSFDYDEDELNDTFQKINRLKRKDNPNKEKDIYDRRERSTARQFKYDRI